MKNKNENQTKKTEIGNVERVYNTFYRRFCVHYVLTVVCAHFTQRSSPHHLDGIGQSVVVLARD